MRVSGCSGCVDANRELARLRAENERLGLVEQARTRVFEELNANLEKVDGMSRQDVVTLQRSYDAALEEIRHLSAENERLRSEVDCLTISVSGTSELIEDWKKVRALLREAREVVIDSRRYLGRGFMGDVQELEARLEHVRATIDAALGEK